LEEAALLGLWQISGPMKKRWQSLRANVGLLAALRTVILVVVFAVIAWGSAMGTSDVMSPVAWLVGMIAPMLFRRWLVEHVATTARVLHASGLVLVGAAFIAGWARGRIWEAWAVGERWLLPALVLAVTLYLSAFFWTFSDTEVVRLK
jgi:hypothetical protein